AHLVPLHDVMDGRGPGNADAVPIVSGEEVAGAGRRSPHRVVGRVVDVHAVEAVAERGGAGGVGAHLVPLHDVMDGGGPGNADPVEEVSGEEVAGAGCRAPHRVAGRRVDHHAAVAIAHLGVAGVVGADPVALDPVAGGPTACDEDAVLDVCGD